MLSCVTSHTSYSCAAVLGGNKQNAELHLYIAAQTAVKRIICIAKRQTGLHMGEPESENQGTHAILAAVTYHTCRCFTLRHILRRHLVVAQLKVNARNITKPE